LAKRRAGSISVSGSTRVSMNWTTLPSTPSARAALAHRGTAQGEPLLQPTGLAALGPASADLAVAPFKINVGRGKTVRLVDYEDNPEWRVWRKVHLTQAEVSVDTVAVPIGGVFAEAVLAGRTRPRSSTSPGFVDWADSPPPAPPGIQPLTARSRTPSDAPEVGTFDKPVLSIQSPLRLPDPVGLSEPPTHLLKDDLLSTVDSENLAR
jgi:hypothetical protein